MDLVGHCDNSAAQFLAQCFALIGRAAPGVVVGMDKIKITAVGFYFSQSAFFSSIG